MDSAGKIRHRLAQHTIDRRAFAGIEIALQPRNPGLYGGDRGTDRLRRNYSLNADIGTALFGKRIYPTPPINE